MSLNRELWDLFSAVPNGQEFTIPSVRKKVKKRIPYSYYSSCVGHMIRKGAITRVGKNGEAENSPTIFRMINNSQRPRISYVTFNDSRKKSQEVLVNKEGTIAKIKELLASLEATSSSTNKSLSDYSQPELINELSRRQK